MLVCHPWDYFTDINKVENAVLFENIWFICYLVLEAQLFAHISKVYCYKPSKLWQILWFFFSTSQKNTHRINLHFRKEAIKNVLNATIRADSCHSSKNWCCRYWTWWYRCITHSTTYINFPFFHIFPPLLIMFAVYNSLQQTHERAQTNIARKELCVVCCNRGGFANQAPPDSPVQTMWQGILVFFHLDCDINKGSCPPGLLSIQFPLPKGEL